MNSESNTQYKVGQRIGGEFHVLGVFGGEGKSGMGVVYLVHNREAPRPIVLKTFQQLNNKEAKTTFINEAHTWINAGAHPNIVQALWVREIEGQLFICAEYIEPDDSGRNTLTDYIEIGAINLEVTLNWAAQFCYGMEYAESKGVIAHRDIKPDNLMIDTNGTLKVTDFGIAKALTATTEKDSNHWWPFKKKNSPETFSKTQTGSAMGTLPYMAPEQFINAKKTDCRSDIYSFGIILYQMVTGNKYPYQISPLSEDIAREFYVAHAESSPRIIKSVLMPLISKCLEKNPEHRYQNYNQLLSDIKAIAVNQNIRLVEHSYEDNESSELYAKAQSYVALGDKDKALEIINEYTSKFPKNYDGWTEKGRIHFQRKEYEEAVIATEKSLSINPYNTHAWNNLGVGLKYKNAPFDEQIDAFKKALKFDPFNIIALSNLLNPLIECQNYDDAVFIANRALTLNSDKKTIIHNSEALLTILLQNKKFILAENLLSTWLEIKPKDSNLLHNLGLVFLGKNDSDSAISVFEKIHSINPEDNFHVEQLAKLYFERKKAAECLKYCGLLIDRHHNMNLAISLKARVLSYVGGYDRALKFILPYIKHNPDNDSLYVIKSEIHEYHGKIKAALMDLKKAKDILLKQKPAYNSENLKYIEEKINILSK